MIQKRNAEDLQIGDILFVEGRKLKPRVQFPIIKVKVTRRTAFDDGTMRFYFYLLDTGDTVGSGYVKKDAEYDVVIGE